jgi:hypothetical protein
MLTPEQRRLRQSATTIAAIAGSINARHAAFLSASVPLQPDGSAATSGFVGLSITASPPHMVDQVEDLVDPNGVRQGQDGYANRKVEPGDRLVAIDGVPVLTRPIEELHRLLRGEDRTIVHLTLTSRRGTHEKYRISVMRHRAHEFDTQIRMV